MNAIDDKRKLLLRIVLTVPPPTTNRILAMNHWERKKLRDLTDQLISITLQNASDSVTQTRYLLNTSQIAWLTQAYLKMIRPNTSKKYRTANRNQKKKAQKF